MELTDKNKLKPVVIIAALLITPACGNESGTPAKESLGAATASGEGVSVTNTVARPADMQPGDIYQAVFTGGQQGLVDLKDAPAAAQFDLAVVNLSVSGNSSTLQMSDDLSGAAPDLAAEPGAESWRDPSLQEAFDNQLRGMELALAADAPPQPMAGKWAKGVTRVAPPALGTTEGFRVISSLSRGSAYADVTGKVVCLTDDTIFYEDVEVERRNPADLTSQDIATLCRNFQGALAAERALFGEPSDVNGDGHVAVLLTPQVNRLGASGGGIITGFFYANDLYPRSAGNPASNGREILFLMVPDSKGLYGTTIEKDFALSNLIPAVLPHEMQHAISYNLHVIEKRGAPEENWLNEGLSHLAEDLLGYGIENPSRYALYLQRPEMYGLVTAASPGLAARGGIFLFLRYLYEQHPDGKRFVWNLLHSDKTGVANCEESYASTDKDFDQFAEFFLRWSAALALNDRGISKDPRFAYTQRAKASTGYWQGVCTVCAPEDNRGTALDGVQRGAFGNHVSVSLQPATVQYYAVGVAPKQISLWSSNAGAFGVVLMRRK